MVEHPTRRDVVVVGAALTVAAGAGVAAASRPAVAQAAAKAVGIVSEQAADGTKGAPVAGVLVSNGREVTRTDAQGRFSLPIAPGQTIFMVKPSGFSIPVDAETRLPKFSYVHDPQGTPAALGFRYAGLPPTGPLPPSIEFALIRTPEPAAFEVILLTDPQPESTTEIGFVRDDVVCGLIGSRAAFGITCGDIAFDDLAMYGRINRIIGQIGIPWWNVGGNHDLDYEAPDAKRSRDTFKRVFGASYYAHTYANALFIMLDNVEYLGAGSGKPGEHGAYRGRLPDDQLVFVENLLAATPKDRLIVLVMHIPLRTYLDPADPAQNTANAGDLLKLVEDRPCVSFAGHTHSTEHHYLGAEQGFVVARPHHHHVLTAVSGSWWSGPLDHRGIACADSYDGTPNGYHLLSVAGATYTTRYVPAAEPAARQMRISLETQFHQDDREVVRGSSMIEALRSPITVDQVGCTQLIVNVFDGGPKTEVSFVLDKGDAIAMRRVSRRDPFIAQVYCRYPETIKTWVKPQASSHVWQAPLPSGLPAGTYALRVSVMDEYGRRHTDGMVLEIL